MFDKIFLFVFFILMVLGIYFICVRQGNLRCKEDFATETNHKILQEYTNNAKKRDNVNAKVFHTGVDDIRDILRKKYTISE